MPDQQLNYKAIRAFILSGLKAWHKTDHHVPLLDDLLIIEEAKRELDIDESNSRASIHALKKVISTLLEELREHNPIKAKYISLQYDKLLLVKEIAIQEKLTLEQVKHKIRKGVDHMARSALSREIRLQRETANRLLANLPNPTYHNLIGVDDLRDSITQKLTTGVPSTPILGLIGIGGIGKTSLMRESVLKTVAMRTFENLVWVYVRGTTFAIDKGAHQPLTELTFLDAVLSTLDNSFSLSAEFNSKISHLHSYFDSTKTLLVIDNIETSEQLETILETTISFGDQLTTVFSSRVNPGYRPKLATITIRELGEQASYALMQQHAKHVGCPHLVNDTETHKTIFKKVGGNPMAIKLIIGLSTKIDLPLILRDLHSAKHHNIEKMYLSIFEKSWLSLSEAGQQLLMIMPLSTERGMSYELMERTSGLNLTQLSEAIDELSTRSLIEINGTALARTYGIHQLTRAFLGSRIIGWDGLLPGLAEQ